jgi:hypothetical protein
VVGEGDGVLSRRRGAAGVASSVGASVIASTARFCGGKNRPTVLAGAPEGEKKRGTRGGVRGSSTAPNAALYWGGDCEFRRDNTTAWRRLCVGKREGMEEGVRGFIAASSLRPLRHGKEWGSGDRGGGGFIPEK